jgi:hypothetical protein
MPSFIDLPMTPAVNGSSAFVLGYLNNPAGCGITFHNTRRKRLFGIDGK